MSYSSSVSSNSSPYRVVREFCPSNSRGPILCLSRCSNSGSFRLHTFPHRLPAAASQSTPWRCNIALRLQNVTLYAYKCDTLLYFVYQNLCARISFLISIFAILCDTNEKLLRTVAFLNISLMQHSFSTVGQQPNKKVFLLAEICVKAFTWGLLCIH